MKAFLQKNGVQILLILIAIGVAWGLTQAGVQANTMDILETKEDVMHMRTTILLFLLLSD